MAPQSDFMAVQDARKASWIRINARRLWVAVFVLSQLVFAIYIYMLYGIAFVEHSSDAWDFVFENLHEADGIAANAGISLHLALGAFIMIIGPLQFVPLIRERTPRVHHWTGRTFLLFAALTALGGLIFIVMRGTVGGLYMDIGFGSYGILLLVCVWQAWRNAITRHIDVHRRWAIRVFLMCTCSWMWRIDYTAWAAVHNCTDANLACAGHTPDFQGMFDNFMAFAFYIIPMTLLELYFYFERTRSDRQNPLTSDVAVYVTLPIMIVGALGIYYYWWAPGINCALSILDPTEQPVMACVHGVTR